MEARHTGHYKRINNKYDQHKKLCNYIHFARPHNLKTHILKIGFECDYGLCFEILYQFLVFMRNAKFSET